MNTPPAPDGASPRCALKLRRVRGENSWWETFDVPFEPSMTFLDALLWVRAEVDPNLGFDYACITNNTCKLCQARIDGTPGYLCAVRATPGEHTIEPVDVDRATFDLFLPRDDVF
ncbi:MAG: 2Fe-2S iron-sulfur cluster-binding protein [Nitriliruptoraceae bacterium]